MIVFTSEGAKETFRSKVGIGSWFAQLLQASNYFFVDERVMWIDIEGIPLKIGINPTFCRHWYGEGKLKPSSKGSKGAELVDGLVIKDEDYKVVKTRFSAFFATNLHSVLQAAGIDSLVVVGVQTPNCIRQTVFDVVGLDYKSVTVIVDATAAATPDVHAGKENCKSAIKRCRFAPIQLVLELPFGNRQRSNGYVMRSKNSKYFHSVLKGRRSKSKIHSIKDKDGITYEGEQIPKVFLKHFQEFLGTKNLVQEIASFENMFRNKLRLCDAEKMIRDVSDKEIKDAIFDIDDAKAPGPDGFSAAFFKNKVLTNRIKPILGKLVSCNQSAFITGRHIQDNIMLTQEIMKGYNRRGGPKTVAFKIDIQKAYDTVNWEFLEKTLSGFGFHKRMIKWIMQCVTTAAFTLNINGERIGYFKGGKGKLPVRYLGVPLIAKRLGVNECGCLIDKIKRIAGGKLKERKVDSWGWKNLLIIRDQVKDNIFYKVGNGTTTSLWDMRNLVCAQIDINRGTSGFMYHKEGMCLCEDDMAWRVVYVGWSIGGNTLGPSNTLPQEGSIGWVIFCLWFWKCSLPRKSPLSIVNGSCVFLDDASSYLSNFYCGCGLNGYWAVLSPGYVVKKTCLTRDASILHQTCIRLSILNVSIVGFLYKEI
ncbi:probable inactive nicotinamidase [Tanacetum coccineum]